MIEAFGTLSWPELIWLVSNIVGLVLAVLAAAENQIDIEAVRILGQRGQIAGADVRMRTLKARGNRRDEVVKAFVHGLLLVVGIVVSASPTPRQEYEAFTALWSAVAIILVAVALAVGSIYNLRDRRALWRMFDQDEVTGETLDHEHEHERRPWEDVPPHALVEAGEDRS